MSVYIYVVYVQAVLCTFVLIVYIYGVASFSQYIMLRRSAVDAYM